MRCIKDSYEKKKKHSQSEKYDIFISREEILVDCLNNRISFCRDDDEIYLDEKTRNSIPYPIEVQYMYKVFKRKK